MTNTTDTFWSANGVSLQTFAQNIETLGGSRMAPPKPRGDDIVIPYAVGEVDTPKVIGARTVTLAMWVRGANADGSRPASSARAQKFDDNWRDLRNLLWNQGRQFNLQKRFYVNGVLRTATARARYEDGLEPTMLGRYAARCTVDLRLADPYFYDDELKTFSLVNGEQTINVLGDADTRNISITINGSRNKTRIIRGNPAAVEVQYFTDVPTGHSARIDVPSYTATATPSGAPQFDTTGKVKHFGAPEWLTLVPGNNIINVSSETGLGTIQLQARGAWI